MKDEKPKVLKLIKTSCTLDFLQTQFASSLCQEEDDDEKKLQKVDSIISSPLYKKLFSTKGKDSQAYGIFTRECDRDENRDQVEIIVPCGNVHTGLRQGQGLLPIVSCCASPVPCTDPVTFRRSVTTP